MFPKNPMDPLRGSTFMSFIKNYQFCDFSPPPPPPPHPPPTPPRPATATAKMRS